MFKKPIYNFLYSLFLVLLTAGFSSYFNRLGMKNFYSYIKLSALTPPNIVFPFVWMVLYALLALSFDMILNAKNNNQQKKSENLRDCSLIFITNLFLHVLWSFVFFYNAYFLAAFAIIICLACAAVLMVDCFYKVQKTAAMLLIPYVAWLLFAAYLNWVVVELNGVAYAF